MNISIWILFGILFTHWIADFCLQTDWQAKNKSVNNKALLGHTLVYSLVWVFFCAVVFTNNNINEFFHWKWLILTLKFVGITFVLHTITDYITSRINSRLYAKGDVHNFFVSLGLDQLSHYIQLVLTFYFLTH